MYDYGHFCLLIFAQGVWKTHYRSNLLKKISTEFLSILEPKSEAEAKQMIWDEIDKSPLFEPKYEEKCKVCSKVSKIFEAKKGSNEGLILFSHNVPEVEGFRTFITLLLSDTNIKKVNYLELEGISEEAIPSSEKIDQVEVDLANLIDQISKKQFKLGTLYEISKYASKKRVN